MTSHRVIDMVEEYAREQIRRAAARVTLNTGFARAGTRAFNVLADVMRKYLQQMWLRAKMVAEHAGRLQPNFLDASIVLNDMHISVEEMEEYMRQVGPFGPERKVPKFPVKPATSVDSCGVALVERHGRSPGSDSPCLPVVPSESQNDATVEKNSSSAGIDVEPSKASVKVKPIDVKRAATSNDVFPDFSGLSARALGFVRQERLPIHEPSILPKQAAVSDLEHNVEQYNCDSNKDEVSMKPTSIASPQSSSSIILKARATEGASKSVQGSSNMACAQRSSATQSRMFGMPPYMSVGVRSFPKVKKTFKPRKHEAGGEIDVRKKIPKHRGERKIEEKERNDHNEVVTSSSQFAAPLAAFLSTIGKNIRRQTSDFVSGDDRRDVLSPFVTIASASTTAPAESDEKPRIRLIFRRENGRANFSIASSSAIVSPSQSSSILTKSSSTNMQTMQAAPTNLKSSNRGFSTDVLNASTSSGKKNRREKSMKMEGGKPEQSKNENVKDKTNERDRNAKHRKRGRAKVDETTNGEHASKVPKIRIKIPYAWNAAKAQQVDNKRLKIQPIASASCAQEAICSAPDNPTEGTRPPPSMGTCVAPSSPLSEEMGVGRNVKLSNNSTSTGRERSTEQSRSKKTRRHVKRANCTANAERITVPPKASRKSNVTLFSNPAKFLGNRPRGWIESLADTGEEDSVDERKV